MKIDPYTFTFIGKPNKLTVGLLPQRSELFRETAARVDSR